jgi:hypothetical protein
MVDKRAVMVVGAAGLGLGLWWLLKKGAQGSGQPFDMEIVAIDTEPNKFATSFRVAEIYISLANNADSTAIHRIRCIAGSGTQQGTPYGPSDPDDLEIYKFTRHWESGYEELEVVLGPGEGISLVSPFYFVWPPGFPYEGLEDNNNPQISSHGSELRKYYFRVIDENNNWSPVASVGTYVG